MKKQDYYIGLDIGTNSVGWAVTDESYNILTYKGKNMWGSRLFDEAKTAKDRRLKRSNRRRLNRRKQRLNLLREIFEKPIKEKDPLFFERLKDSSLFVEDKNQKITDKNTIFSDKNYTDADYHREFPTIYHLRKALMEGKKEYDIRLVYLAVHNILKHRGHFLFEGKDMGMVTSFKNVFQELENYLEDSFEIQMECNSVSEVEEILKDKELSKTKKKESLCKAFLVTKDEVQKKAMLGLMAGTTEKLYNVFNDGELKDLEKDSICFSAASYEEDRENLEGTLLERAYLIDKLKAIYDWSLLAEILDGGEVKEGKLKGKSYLSVAKVRTYEKHKKDLILLKKVIKKYYGEKKDDHYKRIFKSTDEKANYAAYVGVNKKNGKSAYITSCKKEDFIKFLKPILDKLPKEDEDVVYLLKEIENGGILPLQITSDNGVIPYQVHKVELQLILENASKYLPFLNEMDEECGYTNKEKILSIFEFRIPYYVGPLNAAFAEQGANYWMVRKESGPIRPWNFERKVDLDESAEKFITRMTNNCTYLYNETVLPKNSLLYSEFKALNELNNVKISNEKITLSLKKKIIQELYKKKKKVTKKRLLSFLKKEGFEIAEDEISGIDQDFKNSLNSYYDFKNKIGIDLELHSNREMVEQIIFWMTVYSDGGKILRRKIENNYGDTLSEEQINRICKMQYSGWGNLSKEFLSGIQGMDKETGEVFSIIEALRNTDNNLNQLLSYRFTFKENIDEFNKEKMPNISKISYENLVKDLYVSPAVKRSIWQTLLITEEIKKIMGSEPQKIFIEMARGEEEKVRTASRKNTLLQLYKAIQDDMKEYIAKGWIEDRDWISEIEGRDESEFRAQNLFLYYTQMGRDMYSGKAIDINDILSAHHVFDRDHIYPQSKTKDDSLLNNKVLVNKNDNKRKGDGIVPLDIQQKMASFWRMLKRKKFITEEKYQRLVRKDPLTDEELAEFINRQIVETRQSSKAVANLLENVYQDSKIIYVKAGIVADFKRDYDIVKVRDLNDYHHAKDAYLNIVIGNVYNSKFTENPYRWIKNAKKEVKKTSYNLRNMYKANFVKNNMNIWKAGEEGTIKIVKEMLNNKRILFTRFAYCDKGQLFDENIVCAGKGKQSIKGHLSTEKYGGYNSVKSAYFMLVESDDKKKRKRTIESVPIYAAKKFEKNPEALLEYCKQELGLENPKILISKIKKKSKMIINGFPLFISGHNGLSMELQCGAQLILTEEQEKCLKKISKYVARNTANKNKKEVVKITQFDGITKEENLVLYQVFYDKLKNSIYKKRPATPLKVLEEGKDKFIELTVEEQSLVLWEVLHLMQCNPLNANLIAIEGTKAMGRIRISKNISKCESAKLINQSPTGLIEQEIDLLKI